MKSNENNPDPHIPSMAAPPRFSIVTPLSLPGAPLANALYVDALYTGALDAGIGYVSTYPNIVSDSMRAIRREQEAERRADMKKQSTD